MSVIAMLMPVELRARMTGRSLWALRFTDGKVITEGEVDWSLAPQRGRQSLRLYTPTGKVAELGNTQAADGRLFQLKAGTISAGAGKRTNAHIIGIITGTDGQCQCAAWDYAAGALLTFTDNANAMQYANIGRLSADVLGIRPD